MDKASRAQEKILGLVSIVAAMVQSPLLKEAMRQLGHPIQPYVKSPLPQITEEQKGIVRKTLTDLGLIKGKG